MLTEIITSLFERDLLKLIQEIELYNNEENLWRVENNISNSAGNLALHIIGNLNAYIGKNVPREKLLAMLNDTLVVIKTSLSKLTQTDLGKEYPALIFKEKTSTAYLLIHLTTHLSYHLGQINYHRRLIDL